LKNSSILNAAIAVSLASLLAACGGGGDSASPTGSGATPPPELPAVAWASPAVFVTPGASSKTLALNCTTQTDTYSAPNYNRVRTSGALVSATLKISANGDTVVSAATSTSGPISALQSIALADATSYSWRVNGTLEAPLYILELRQQDRNTTKRIEVISESEGTTVNLPNGYFSTQTSYGFIYYSCNSEEVLALQINPDQARAAKNLGAAAGVTMYDDYRAQGRIEGEKAFWATDVESEATSPYAFMRFDLRTGGLASSMDLPRFHGQLEVLDLGLIFHQIGDGGFAVV
jgi:hypothetical protein